MSLFSDEFLKPNQDNTITKSNSFIVDLHKSTNFNQFLQNVKDNYDDYNMAEQKSVFNFTQNLIGELSRVVKNPQDQKVVNIVSSSIRENYTVTMLNFLSAISDTILNNSFKMSKDEVNAKNNNIGQSAFPTPRQALPQAKPTQGRLFENVQTEKEFQKNLKASKVIELSSFFKGK